MWGCAQKINTNWENLQIEKHKSVRWAERRPSWFVLFDLQIFLSGVYPPSATSRTISFFLFPIVFSINLIYFFDEKDRAAGSSFVCFGASIPCHAIWQRQNDECEFYEEWKLFRRVQSFWQQKSANSAPFNPLSAKLSFQVWYPGGQRLKVISFSWSGVKSPSKCFSNTEPTTTIASLDEKRCNAAVQWTRSVHSSSLRLGDQHRKCHGWLLLFAVSALQPDRPAAVHQRTRKQRSAKR